MMIIIFNTGDWIEMIFFFLVKWLETTFVVNWRYIVNRIELLQKHNGPTSVYAYQYVIQRQKINVHLTNSFTYLTPTRICTHRFVAALYNDQFSLL